MDSELQRIYSKRGMRMNEVKDYVDFRLTHSDKFAQAEGYPLELSNCKKYKPMRDLKIYGNSYQSGTPSPETPIEVQSVGELVTDEADVNFGKYKIAVVSRGVNLFCMAKLNATAITVNGITFTPLDDERVYIKGKVIDTSKNTVVKFLSKSNGNMPIKRGTYRAKPNKFTFSGLTLMFGINNNSAGKNVNSIHDSTAIEFDNAYIGNLYLGIIGDGLTREWDDIIELQLMEGTENLPYEPYVEPVISNIFLNEPLSKLGNYSDYVDFKSNKVVRKCCKRYLKDYFWRDYITYTDDVGVHYDIFCKDNSIIPSIPNPANLYDKSIAKSNIFPIYAFSTQEKVHYGIVLWTWSANVRVQFPQEYCADTNNVIASFNAWLNEYNPYMLRVLSQPAEETIALDIPKLKAKTSIIEVDTSLAPSNAYGKYIKR